MRTLLALSLLLFAVSCAKKPPVVDPAPVEAQCEPCPPCQARTLVCHNHKTHKLPESDVWRHLRDDLFDYAGPCKPRGKK